MEMEIEGVIVETKESKNQIFYSFVISGKRFAKAYEKSEPAEDVMHKLTLSIVQAKQSI